MGREIGWGRGRTKNDTHKLIFLLTIRHAHKKRQNITTGHLSTSPFTIRNNPGEYTFSEASNSVFTILKN